MMPTSLQTTPATKTASTERTVYLLVVDDEAPITWMLKEDLEDAFSCVVLTATDSQAALQHLETHPTIALMITDYKMPGMDGLALAELVRQQFPQTAMVMLTAYVTPELTRQAEAASIRYVLNKPVKLPEIRRVVSEILAEGLLTG